MNEVAHEAVRESTQGSRTGIHVAGALVATAVLIGAVLMAPVVSNSMKERQIRSIQKAVEVDLNLIMERETQFHQRYGFYTTDLRALGIAPKRVLYKFGFVSPSTHGKTIEGFELAADRMNLDALKAGDPSLKIEYSPLTQLAEIDFASVAKVCPDCTATESTFKAVAAANLDDDDDLDIWTVDEKGNLRHVFNDLDDGSPSAQ